MRTKLDAAALELGIQPADMRFERGAIDRHRQVAQTQLQESLVGQARPVQRRGARTMRHRKVLKRGRTARARLRGQLILYVPAYPSIAQASKRSAKRSMRSRCASVARHAAGMASTP